MPTTATESLPKHIQFLIGRNERRSIGATSTPAFSPTVGVIERARYEGDATSSTQLGPRLLHCLVRNDGDADLLLQVEQSANNNTANLPGYPALADAYADIPIRVEGAAASNGELTVVPGGQAVFLIEWGLNLDAFIRFVVNDEQARGEITVSHYEGHLVRREGGV